MSSFPLDITSISIVLSIISLALAMAALLFLSINVPKKVHDSNEVDAFALVQEFRNRNFALEEKLVDLRVRLEILDLRVARLSGKSEAKVSASLGQVQPLSSSEVLDRKPSFSPVSREGPRSFPTVDPIRREILSAVKEANGSVTSRDVQLRIGRSREHVARTMNLLRKEGFLYRNQGARPFTYSITGEGESELRTT
jgi:hypothetical protein